MTEDQIKAIAKEYVEQLTLKDLNTEHCPTKEGVIRVLEYLSARYCIVEREKVIKEYNLSKKNIEKYDYSDVVRYANHGALSIMGQLFGTSMFNQNEE